MPERRVSGSRIFRELVEAGGNVRVAARLLGLKTEELRLMVRKEPGLMEAGLEAAEQALDRADAVLRQGLNSANAAERLAAAGAMVRSQAGKRRRF